ncbi:MAG: hypothetical protein AB2417_10060 [Clostridiaceae bacterium]
MIEVSYFREQEKIRFLPKETQEIIQGILHILDIEYGADRNKYEDAGGYVVVVEKIEDFKEIMDKAYIDCSVVYPVDSICRMKDEQRKETISNIIKNTVNKVFVVSWTDNYDYSWLDEFGIDRIAVFDAEEGDVVYHNRVLSHINEYK